MTGNQQSISMMDKLKWLVVFVLLGVGIWANQYYSQYAGALRVMGWIILALVALGIAATTAKGKLALGFAKEARIEMRKVVWPTRQETIQTTLIVIVMVFIAALFLWGIDSLLLVMVRWFMG